MSTTQEKVGPREKAAAERTGACIIETCKCETFELTGIMDGFRMCACNHTQFGHSKQATVVS